MAKETFTFQAEVGKILDIVAHSLYSEKEVFLRELISNASDACDKLRYASIAKPELSDDGVEFKIRIDVDKKASELKILDNGIGMSKKELVESLGTIARSGTQAFLKNISDADKSSKDIQSSLIGQFGVGFYSAFMVAKKITVNSKKAGSNQSWSWSSDGKGSFEIESASKKNVGTEIILKVDEKDKEYLEEDRIESIVKKYSDHIAQPVVMETKEKEEKVLNSASALWTRDKKNISNDQYKEFYHHVGMAYDDPWMIMHNKAEGLISYTNLLFIPSNRPFDLFNPDRKSNLKLYVKRVFITDDCEGLIPPYLRFIKGIIDTDDIDLNISREMLQNNPVVAKIKNALIKRVISELKKKAENDSENYVKFWEAFGPVLKEGIHEDFANRDKILEVSRFQTSHSKKLTSLKNYVSRMKKGQDTIYYLSGEDKEKLSQSPHLEGFRAKGVEVLYMTDPVDEFWLPSVGKYSEKSFQSITRGSADLDKIKSKNTDKKDKKDVKKENIDKLIASLKVVLGKEVKDIKSSERLTDSAVCLVAGEGDMDMHLEKLLKQHQQLDSTSQKILEINPSHPLIKNLLNVVDDQDKKNEIFDDAAWLLLDQARIIEGQSVLDPNKFTKRMNTLIQKGITL